MTGPVVVGLDGSPASVTAAWWAAREAADRRLPLLLLHSWTTQPLDVPIAQEALAKQRYGGQVLRRAEAELLHRHPGLAVTTELVPEPAAPALLGLARTASLLVLGSRGLGSVTSFLLGSISLHVLGLTPCPAVTVRAGDPAVETGFGHPAADGRDEIVVGVQDIGAGSDTLLEFAFGRARTHGDRVRAVRAVPLAVPPGGRPARPEDADEEAQRAVLTAALAAWRTKFPDVPVTEEVVVGSAAQVLLAASAHSRLTVVGRHRNPVHHPWKLGPVAHAALHHLPCPVAVVPHD
ncbi:universal stress protein [Streptomyces sp. NPDC047000]|uniref:universal stress protein n=1 Tax=Streptomyces sp. NPDC047000 TaxID=3155474 RepID=UPI00340849BE